MKGGLRERYQPVRKTTRSLDRTCRRSRACSISSAVNIRGWWRQPRERGIIGGLAGHPIANDFRIASVELAESERFATAQRVDESERVTGSERLSEPLAAGSPEPSSS